MPAAAHPRSEGPAGHPQLKRLIIRPGAIGDVVVSLPALEYLKTDYTEVWTPGRTVPLIRFADRVRSIASTGLDLVGVTEHGNVLRDLQRFDEIVSWYGANRPEFRDVVADLPFVFHQALPTDPAMHAADFFVSQVGAPLGRIPVIECSHAKAGFVAIHPFSGSPSKDWPLENYKELADRLGTDVRVCVGPDQHLAGAVYIEDLYDVAGWLASARLYIGNDSGITHLAAAVGTPVIALFGPTDPSVWAPRGTHVTVLRKPDMRDISVSEVIAVVDRIMSAVDAQTIS
jgi:ADP-heptose:LPS heptosyltransferase